MIHSIESKRVGFTLIEVLVVVAIIALLVAILLPSLSNARKEAKKAVCLSNNRQIATGNYYYSQDWRTKLPHSDHWLYNKTITNQGTFRKTQYPAPESGDLMGRKGMPGTLAGKKGYIFVPELFKCPLDSGYRRQTVPSPDMAPIKPTTFSSTRNVYVMQALSNAKLWDDNGYLPWDKPKFPAKTPLMVEEGEESSSPLNDGEFWNALTDVLSVRHQNKAVMSYLDLHTEAVNALPFNDTSGLGIAKPYRHYVMAPGIPWTP